MRAAFVAKLAKAAAPHYSMTILAQFIYRRPCLTRD